MQNLHILKIKGVDEMEKMQLERYKERNEIIKEIIKLKEDIKKIESKKIIKELEKLILKGLNKRVEILSLRKDILINGIIKESLERKKEKYN
jgi:hypothetical protein